MKVRTFFFQTYCCCTLNRLQYNVTFMYRGNQKIGITCFVKIVSLSGRSITEFTVSLRYTSAEFFNTMCCPADVSSMGRRFYLLHSPLYPWSLAHNSVSYWSVNLINACVEILCLELSIFLHWDPYFADEESPDQKRRVCTRLYSKDLDYVEEGSENRRHCSLQWRANSQEAIS